jgi:hypothetical protein
MGLSPRNSEKWNKKKRTKRNVFNNNEL